MEEDGTMKQTDEKGPVMYRLAPPQTGSIPHELLPLLPANWPTEIPLARVTTCGSQVSLEVLYEIQPESDGPATLVYGPPDATLLAEKSASTALILLSILASQPGCAASIDWLSETLRHPHQRDEEDDDDDREERPGLKRVDNIVTLLRHLLFPPILRDLPTARQLRRRLVPSYRASGESGSGYRLAGMPLVWIDVEAIKEQIKQARSLDQFGQDGLPAWQAAYALAERGVFLEREPYSDWASWRRQQVETQKWECVQALWQRLANQGAAGESEALRILQSYWQGHVTNEDAFRPLIELLGQRECYGQAEEAYAHVCLALDLEGRQPDHRTQEVMTFLRALKIQRKPPQYQSTCQEAVKEPSPLAYAPTSPIEDKTLVSSLLHAIIEMISGLEGVIHLDASRRRLFQQTLLLLGSSEILSGIPAKAILSTHDEMLPFYSTAIPACWSLIYSGGIKYVEKVLPSYIAHLINFVQQSPQHRKIAANLASQGFQIASMIALENEDYHFALSHIGDAIAYAEFTQDISIETAALMRKVTVLWYWRRYPEMHETLKIAEKNIKSVSPLMQANIYSALSADIIESNEQQKVLRNIERAKEFFPQDAEMDPIFSSTYITRYLMYFNENVAYMNFKRYEEAWNALEMAENYVSPVPSSRRMELLTHQISVAVALGDLGRSDEKMKEAIAMNSILTSNLWFSTLKDIYEVFQKKWGENIKIKVLGELLFHK